MDATSPMTPTKPLAAVAAVVAVAVLAAIVAVVSPPSEPVVAFTQVAPATVACPCVTSEETSLKSRWTRPI
jgi:hypothetical protein